MVNSGRCKSSDSGFYKVVKHHWVCRVDESQRLVAGLGEALVGEGFRTAQLDVMGSARRRVSLSEIESVDWGSLLTGGHFNILSGCGEFSIRRSFAPGPGTGPLLEVETWGVPVPLDRPFEARRSRHLDALRRVWLELCSGPGVILAYEEVTNQQLTDRLELVAFGDNDMAGSTVDDGRMIGLPAVPSHRAWFGKEYARNLDLQIGARASSLGRGVFVVIGDNLPTRRDIQRSYGIDMPDMRLKEEISKVDLYPTLTPARRIPIGVPRVFA